MAKTISYAERAKLKELFGTAVWHRRRWSEIDREINARLGLEQGSHVSDAINGLASLDEALEREGIKASSCEGR